MKKFSILALLLCLFISASVVAEGSRPQCPLSGEKGGYGDSAKKGCRKSPCPITNALMKKSHFLLSHASEIGLSEDQVKQIHAIKMDVAKQAVLGEAQMKVAFMDMMAKLHEEKLDVEGLNKMVDEFSSGMAASTKKMIQTYADLRAILTPEQMAKMKEIWKKRS